jgi:N-acetylmuramoyl-L-alanine amidase
MDIVISSGHGKYVRGASGYIDEVDEARMVVDKVASYLTALGVGVKTFHDDESKSQSENLEAIVAYHNAQSRDLDVSIHFNAYEDTTKAMGCEVLYVTQSKAAAELSAALAEAGDFIDRGEKYRSDLFFLNNTEMPALLIETCFVDSQEDANLYQESFDEICRAIAETLAGEKLGEAEPPPEEIVEEDNNRVNIRGRAEGDVKVVINGTTVFGGDRRCPNTVSLVITMTGDVVVSLNGEDFHNRE